MISQIEKVYLIGIGGIGMSALARWFLRQGCQVAGYDRQASHLTQQLEAEGVEVNYVDDVEAIPLKFRDDSAGALTKILIIYTPAVPISHPQLKYFSERHFQVLKRAAVLGAISQDFFTVAVAGTHGKTTTSSMIAHLLYQSGRACVAFLGGILQGYESNLIIQEVEGQKPVLVVEADEYDKSFLHLSPNTVVITSTDPDHLDIYGHAEHVKAAYHEFAKKIPPNGRLFIKKGLDLWHDLQKESFEIETYAGQVEGDIQHKASNIRIEKNTFRFDYAGSDSFLMRDVKLLTPGFHNVENAVAAMAVARSLNIQPAKIKEALASFGGARRRFEYIIRAEYEQIVFIDDYAHHPAELKALLNSVRALYPNHRISIIFQPHLYTRTRDFASGFAESLSLADQVFLLDIYPAREKPISGVSSKLIWDQISIQDKMQCSKEELLAHLKKQKPEILLTAGAGDIDRMVQPIRVLLEQTYLSP